MTDDVKFYLALAVGLIASAVSIGGLIMDAFNPTPQFGGKRLQHWTALLWTAMSLTGKGYRRDSLKHTGQGDDRRNDKMRETTEEYRGDKGEKRIKTVFVPFLHTESKLERAARLQRLGVYHGR